MSAKYEQAKKYMIKLMKIADPSGFNEEIVKEFFDNTNEAQLIKYLKDPKFKFRFTVEEYDHEPHYPSLIKGCESIKAVYQERFIIDRENGYVTDAAMPSGILPVPSLQQKGESESAAASDTNKRNSLGQVVGASKGAQMSDIEFSGLIASGRIKSAEEMTKVRSGTDSVKMEVYNELDKTGRATMDDKEIDPEERKEVNAIKNIYYGMNLIVQM